MRTLLAMGLIIRIIEPEHIRVLVRSLLSHSSPPHAFTTFQVTLVWIKNLLGHCYREQQVVIRQ
jgi:hypothetical protein